MKIAISGPMCSGKSTIAKFICENNSDYKVYSFGQKIKDLAIELFGMDKNTKDRSLLINIANKMKEINQNVWINYIIKECLDKENCLIDDLRFENELNVLKNSGDWYFIVLQIPKETRIKRIKELYPDNFEDHIKNINDISEKGLKDFPKDKTLYISEDTTENIEKSIKDFISQKNKLNDYQIYMRDNVIKIKKENPNLSHKEAFTISGLRWKESKSK